MVGYSSFLKRWPVVVTAVLIAAFSWYFTWFTFGRHAKTNSGRFDLGNVEQTVWNVVHGRGFTMTDPYGIAQVSRLAFHADVFLILLVPFYALVQRPETLLLLQVLTVASGAMAVFLTGKKLLGPAWWGTMFSAIYLLNPGLQWATIFDVHAVTFATPLVLWAVWLTIEKKYRGALIFMILAMLTKEEIGLTLVALGIYVWLAQKQRRWGAVMTLTPAIWSLAMFFVVLPYFHGQTAGEVYRTVFGNGAASIINGALTQPLRFFHVLFARQNLIYGWQLFSATGLVGIISPWWLAAGPEMVINGLSLKPAQHLIISHYTSGITPWLIVASLAATAWMRKKMSIRFSARLVTWILVLWLGLTVGYSAWTTGPLPATPNDQTKFVTWRNPYAQPVREWSKLIPTAAAVSVTNNVGAHFARRERFYGFPLGIDQADYIVVLEDHATPVVATQAEVTEKIKDLRSSSQWLVVEYLGDLTVLRRRE
ncbi:MAG: DUF2079 domain-containing protein [Patescibacteria group bacterium]